MHRCVIKLIMISALLIEQKGESCLFTASGTYRVGKLGKIFFKKALKNGLASVRKHMREEGENLKIILEGEGSSHQNRLENDKQ